MAEPNELEAWREVHNKLLIACELAQEAVDAERMQHRYWMEELAANLILPAGATENNNSSSDNNDAAQQQQYLQLSSTSVWARAMAPKKTISKKKMAQLYKKRRGKAGKRKAPRAKKPAADEDSSHGPPRKLRIKMKKPKPATPPTPPAPAARGDEQLYEETEDEEVDDDDDNDDDEEEEDDEEANDYHQLHHHQPQQQQQQQHREASSSVAAVASSYNNSSEYSTSGTTAQQYVGQNPLQMMAAVAFGTSQPYSPAVETPSYLAYMSNNNRASFNSRASNIETYGSLQDIADEDDDEDAF